MSDHSHWAGLGQRPGAEPPPPLPPGDDDDFERPVVQRTVAAADAPSVVPKNAFHLPFLRASSNVDEAADSAADEQPEEKTMPKATATPTRAKGVRNIQHRICALLLHVKNMTRDEIGEQLTDLDTKQLSQALFQVVAAKRAEKVIVKGGTAFQITAGGRAYMEGISTGDEPPAPPRKVRAKPGKAVRKPRAAATAKFAEPHASTALAVRDFDPVVERSFRCAVFSDGAFNLKKNGVEIDLSPNEHAEMLRYLERMAEQPGA